MSIITKDHNTIGEIGQIFFQDEVNHRNIFYVIRLRESQLNLIVAIKGNGRSTDFK